MGEKDNKINTFTERKKERNKGSKKEKWRERYGKKGN